MVIIAIDGPAASGKSTIAKLLASKLDYLYIDSGAMYRAVTCKWLSLKTDNTNDEALLTEIVNSIRIEFEENSKKVIINGEDLTEAIRTNNVSNNVSYVASFAVVRDKLVNTQRVISQSRSVVMDGRDIGTVVFPRADFKFFMVASAEVRARRRLKDLKEEKVELSTLIEQIKERDKKDSEREHSPLLKANDAIEINTDNLSIEDVLEKLSEKVTSDKAST